MNKSMFHELQGKDIYFKQLSTKDTKEVHSYASNEDVSRFIGWQLKQTINDTQAYIEEMLRREEADTHLYASIVHKESDIVIGTAMIFNFDHGAKHAEVGYVFHNDYWGKGYGTEAVTLMTNFSFDILNLRKLHARVISGNPGSVGVLEKNGFVMEGRLKDFYYIEGVYYDNLIFSKFFKK
ncbi:GNAT family N-acetyltransferase [Alkaliphilus peptidifermentans]|uniref:Ribosomal-protein-alanine N-acetyltransferase n=1 Tax=Alkaliphilus peptidifermentans DSM 18978 TaxID=1120976 RepID=A0A1G5KQY6_9FIRM|nr:GNAT family N-acetyltransferase [Alkaliphilus peptidifermentans]SCZ03015.1 ribosomal-protein-alanine N-acetyltransferase [Alkaliphilus peptidifermentans DSM 18978]